MAMVFECEPGEQGVKDGSLMVFRMNLSGRLMGIQHLYMSTIHGQISTNLVSRTLVFLDSGSVRK